MTAPTPTTPTRSNSDQAPVVQAVTVIMGTVVGLTFLFGFGNVLNLALRLGVPAWVAPLIAPAVDLSILRLLLGTRHLALHGAKSEQLRPARRLLIFASIATLALNIADPLVTGTYGKAAFDAVGPLLLMVGRSGTGTAPGHQPHQPSHDGDKPRKPQRYRCRHGRHHHEPPRDWANEGPDSDTTSRPATIASDGYLIDRARHEDARHWATHQRPISAETLRKNLRISAARSRMLVSIVRAERSANQNSPQSWSTKPSRDDHAVRDPA